MFQNDYYFSVEINGVEKIHILNKQPKMFENVKVYACDQHFGVAKAKIRNLKVLQASESTTTTTTTTSTTNKTISTTIKHPKQI